MVGAYPVERFVSAAAMNLWGPNAIGINRTTADSTDGIALDKARASRLAPYGPSRSMIERFATSLAPFAPLGPLSCTARGASPETITVCIAHLVK
jgi:hypothetical protein